MPDRHREKPLSLRLPPAERQRLDDYARKHGQPVRRVIKDAVTALLDKDDDALAERRARIEGAAHDAPETP
jgi:predicted DNA-binding protein